MYFKQGPTVKDFIRVGDTNNEIPFRREHKPGLAAELDEWLKSNELLPYDERSQAEIDLEEKKAALINSKPEIIRLIEKNEYHIVTINPKKIKDKDSVWVPKLMTWYSQLDQINAEIAKMEAGEDFDLIEIDDEPVFD